MILYMCSREDSQTMTSKLSFTLGNWMNSSVCAHPRLWVHFSSNSSTTMDPVPMVDNPSANDMGEQYWTFHTHTQKSPTKPPTLISSEKQIFFSSSIVWLQKKPSIPGKRMKYSNQNGRHLELNNSTLGSLYLLFWKKADFLLSDTGCFSKSSLIRSESLELRNHRHGGNGIKFFIFLFSTMKLSILGTW